LKSLQVPVVLGLADGEERRWDSAAVVTAAQSHPCH